MARPTPPTRLTPHAETRVAQRALSNTALDAALLWGRELRQDGAVVYRIDRRTVKQARRDGVDLSPFEGTTVIESSRDGAVITAYRNRTPDRVRR